METSEQIDKLAAALSKAQGSVEGAKKDSANPHFKSRYADLESVWQACREAITANGLAVLQSPGLTIDGVMHMTTMLTHSSGQWVRDVMSIPLAKVDAQGYGSAVTYCRRYSLAAFLGVAPEDDDGNAASRPNGASNAPKPREVLAGPYTSKTALWNAARAFDRELRGCGDVDQFDAFVGLPESQALLNQLDRDAPNVARTGEGLPDDFEPIIPFMARFRSDLVAIENANQPYEPNVTEAG